jgi:molecular chaperone HscA
VLARAGVADVTRPHVVRRVLDAARALKEALTVREEVSTDVELAPGTPTTLRLTRAEMEALVMPVLQRCAPPLKRALADAGVERGHLSGVILVGGATRMPLVRRFVEEWFGQKPLADIDPDQVVALGAAIQADMLAGGAGHDDVLLLDVVPLSLGLETMGGVAEKLIHRNTTVPCGARQEFTTFADKQTGFDLHVVQGERELVASAVARALHAEGHPAHAGGHGAPRGDVHGRRRRHPARLRARGDDRPGGVDAVKPSYGLTDDEVETMILDSFAHAEDDVKARQLAEQRVEADGHRGGGARGDAGRARAARGGERGRDRCGVEAVEAARAGTDHHAIRAAIEDLDHASKSFATRRMNRALEQGFRGRAVDAVDANWVNGRGAVAVPKVRFEPDGIEIEVPVGTSILEASNKAHARSARRAAASARARPATSTSSKGWTICRTPPIAKRTSWTRRST